MLCAGSALEDERDDGSRAIKRGDVHLFRALAIVGLAGPDKSAVVVFEDRWFSTREAGAF